MTGNIGELFPGKEGEAYDSDGYNTVKMLAYAQIVLIIVFLVSFALLFSSSGGAGSISFTVFIFAISAVVSVIHRFALRHHKNNVSEAKRFERERTLTAARQAVSGTEELSQRIVELEKSMKEIAESAIRTGDIIVTGKNAAVVVGSGSIEVIIGTKETNPALANALTAVLGHIENTQNKESAEYFGKFTEQLNQSKPDKTILRALWEGVVATAPTVKQMTDIVGIISKVFL